ncbi:MAG: hypothetical protein U5K79_07020 [Cyclobacteriaceae bacterium]|nr:hypothetical protein [Cyclobacteriaceae bacterium]
MFGLAMAILADRFATMSWVVSMSLAVASEKVLFTVHVFWFQNWERISCSRIKREHVFLSVSEFQALQKGRYAVEFAAAYEVLARRGFLQGRSSVVALRAYAGQYFVGRGTSLHSVLPDFAV